MTLYAYIEERKVTEIRMNYKLNVCFYLCLCRPHILLLSFIFTVSRHHHIPSLSVSHALPAAVTAYPYLFIMFSIFRAINQPIIRLSSLVISYSYPITFRSFASRSQYVNQ